MRKLLLFIFTLSFAGLKSQDIAAYGKSNSGMVRLYNKTTGQQMDLEKTTAVKKNKQKLGGFGGVEFAYFIEGEKSSVRLNADSAIFVTERNSGMMGMDMSMTLTLYKLEMKSGSRVAVEGKYKPSYAGTGKTTDTKIITSTREIKDGLRQILPEAKLEKGEYAFFTAQMEGNNYDGKNTKYLVYAFGID